MLKTITLVSVRTEDYWHFKDITLTDNGSIILTDYLTTTTVDGKTLEDNNSICLLAWDVAKLKKLLNGETE